jgi:TP901-1 family phage major tail protein
MAIYNGTIQLISIEGETLSQLTNCTMSMNADLFETTTKNSAGWKEVMAGLRDVTYSAEGLADFSDSGKYDLTNLFAAYTGRTILTTVFTNGTVTITQETYISSLEVSAPMEDVATYSLELTGTGVATLA